jgi:hypothetical protein
MANKGSIWNILARMWFPFALIVCLLFMLPGVILFTLNVLGRETEVNRRLEAKLRLSYHIPITWWGALILLFVPPLLILLYFLKLKRKPLEVPSTFLWKKSIEDLHVNSLFQWLRNNVLLLLQLIVLLSLIYAILAPRLHGAGGAGKHYILMIDNSASMSASDVPGGRLEWAKAEAIKEIDAASDDDVGMLIVFNSRAEIRQSYTSNRTVLRQRVSDIEATQRTTHIEEALNLADSLANQRVSSENEAVKPEKVEEAQIRNYAGAEGIRAEVHLYSDGRFPDAPDFVLGNLDLHYHVAGQTGQRTDNVGIVTFDAIRDENDSSTVQVFARLLNFGEAAASVKFEVEVLADGQLIKQRNEQVSIPAAGQPATDDATQPTDRPGERSVTFDLTDLDDQREFVIHGRITGRKDVFPLDDEAWLVVGVVRKAHVLIVGPPNRFLHGFFDDESVKSIAEVTWLSPSDFFDDAIGRKKYLEPTRTGVYDLVVFDRVAPKTEEDMPRANTFFIGTVPPPLKADPSKKAEKFFVKGWATQQPLLKYLSTLHEIGIGTALRIDDLPPKTPRLLEAEDNLVLMFSLVRGPYSDVVQTFALVDENDVPNTNWILQPSFPIFWRRVLYVLGNVSDASTEEIHQPGVPRRIRPTGVFEKVRVTDPAGKSVELERALNRSDFDYQGTDLTGIYQAEWKSGSRRFAVNLLDSEESNLQPRENIVIGDNSVAAQQPKTRSRELWKWAVGLGLLFLLLEWYIYNKRIYV